MLKKLKSLPQIQQYAIAFGIMFLGVYSLNFIPFIHDDQGQMFGLFKLDPIDDFGHLFAGILAVIAGIKSIQWSRIYMYVLGIGYIVDVIVFFVSNLEKYSIPVNIALNAPHIIILVAALYIARNVNVKTSAK